MEKFEEYIIDLKKLTPGVHNYEYFLEGKFFVDLEQDLVKNGEIKVSLSLKKLSEIFELNFHIAGYVWVPCDRCLDDVKVPIETDNRLLVKFGREYSEESEEVVVVPEDEGTINLAWFLYEFIALAVPMKHVHAPGECNEEMASLLKEHMAVDVDDEDDLIGEDGNSGSIDPRWEGLRGLIENNNN